MKVLIILKNLEETRRGVRSPRGACQSMWKLSIKYTEIAWSAMLSPTSRTYQLMLHFASNVSADTHLADSAEQSKVLHMRTSVFLLSTLGETLLFFLPSIRTFRQLNKAEQLCASRRLALLHMGSSAHHGSSAHLSSSVNAISSPHPSNSARPNSSLRTGSFRDPSGSPRADSFEHAGSSISSIRSFSSGTCRYRAHELMAFPSANRSLAVIHLEYLYNGLTHSQLQTWFRGYFAVKRPSKK